MGSRFLIYGLIDPQTQELRYVGKSCSGLKRPRRHTQPASLRRHTYTARWCKLLSKQGLKPEVFVLEEHDTASQLYEAEQFFIQYFRGIGCKLTNLSDGGPGFQGCRHTKISKKKISKKQKGRVVSLETRMKISKSKKGVSLGAFDDAHRRKIAAAQGKPFVDEAGHQWMSQREAARFYGLHSQNINACLKNKISQTGGHTFRYLEVSGG